MSLTFKEYVLIVVASGITTLNVFLFGALTIALPTIGQALHFKQADLQWPLNVYSLSYGCMLPLFGRIGDIIGARTMFSIGTSWFAVWSIATAFAPNNKVFIIFVALTGLGSAANTPAAIGVLTAAFPPGMKRNRALGALSAGQPTGLIMGLVFGGLLCTSRATWRAIFYIQAGLAFLCVVCGWFVLEREAESRRYSKGLDLGGAFLSTIGIGMLTYCLAGSSTASKGWGSPYIIGLFVASFVILGLFIAYEHWRETTQRSVLMPISMWRRPGAKMGTMISLVFLQWWSFNTLTYFSTLYYQQILRLTPIQTAIRFIPMIVSSLIINIGTGYIMSMVPSLPLMLVGMIGNVAAPIIFAMISANSLYWTTEFFVMILVVGADIVYLIGILHISASFDEDSQLLVGGVFNVATRLGTSLGLAVSTTAATYVSQTFEKQHPDLQSDSPEVMMAGFHVAGWICLAVGSLSVLIALARLRSIGIVGQKQEPSMNTKEDDARQRGEKWPGTATHSSSQTSSIVP